MRRLFFLFFCLPLFSEEIHVHLRNPTYHPGELQTREGGVIQAPDLRIQASLIRYAHKEKRKTLCAEGDLLIQYKGKAFVGESLEFDLEHMCGAILGAKTSSSIGYIGGEKIFLNEDGSYQVDHAFITTCENKQSSWDLRAAQIHVVRNEFLKAERVRLRFFQWPKLWLPSFRVNLKKFKEPIFKYYLNWNKGPKLGFRYQLYSWENFAFYGRLEYRWRKGWGGALETEYFPPDYPTQFTTRSYLGTDRLFNAENVERRYRLQGAFHHTSRDQKTKTTLTWDKYSDVRMPGDFKSEDFEVNTALKTLFYVHHRQDNWVAFFKVRPKANPFESIKQDLPTFYTRIRPQEVKTSPLISSFFCRASYLNFDYSDQLVQSLQNFSSPRLEAFEHLYLPLRYRAITLTPHLSGRAIFYGTSPSHRAKTLLILGGGLDALMTGKKSYATYEHFLEPYLEYKALSRPTVNPDQHYIFSIQDGYQKIQQIKVGIRNLFFPLEKLEKKPTFSTDLYANAFFSDPVIPQTIPKLYLDLFWNLPSAFISLKNCYNFRNQVWDFSNTRLLWTVNEQIALSLEGRYRSKFDFRKSDHENFILDVTRPEQDLLFSPLSDRRITLLSHLFIRLNPFWELKFESHHGFYRLFKNEIREKPYNEFQIHLYTSLSSAWKLHLSYGYTLKNHFDWTIDVQLVKKQF